jgi:hypothetical protein
MTALNSGKNLTNAVADANMAEVGRYEFNGGSGSIRNSAATEGTAKVGSFLPNAWGLYDMHGNVCEWCLDRYTKDPCGVTTESYRGVDRVFRGGSWYYYAGCCRSAFRYANNLFYRDSAIGFRVAMPLPSGHKGVHEDGNVSRLITQERERLAVARKNDNDASNQALVDTARKLADPQR